MSYSILIVDDEALTLRTIGRALESEGFEVFLAMSGEEALTTLAEEKPDLALLDVVLPGINGIEVLRQAKKLSPATIVVMMSAYHVVDRAVEAMKLGAYDYLIKPFHIADMVNTIRRATEMLALARARARHGAERQGPLRFWARGDREPGHARGAGDGAPRRRERPHHHPDSGRERHRQGSAGQGDPLQQPARPGAADQPELRRPARHLAGERTVRLRAGRLHRRAPPQGRTDRESLRRHAVPRRDRQHLVQPAGQTAARAGRGNLHAPRRDQADPGGRAHHYRHQQDAEGSGEPKASSAKTCITA